MRDAAAADVAVAEALEPHLVLNELVLGLATSATLTIGVAGELGVEHGPEDETYLRKLGVTDILPRDGDIVELVRERYPDGVDALLDVVSYAPGAFDATEARRSGRIT